MYLSLYSITGCELYLTASFPDLKIQNYHRKQVQENYADEADFEDYLVVKKLKQMTKSKGEKDSMIKEHISRVGKFPQLQAKRAQFLQEKRQLLSEEQTRRKQLLDEHDHKLKYFKLHRWDLLRSIRSHQMEEKEALLKIMSRAKQLIIRGHTYLILKQVCERFVQRREAVRLQKLKERGALKIQRVYNYYMSRLASVSD